MLIHSNMTMSDLLNIVTETMRVMCTIHTLAYEALWCKKSGSKVKPHYLDSQSTLDDLFANVRRF